MKDTIRDNMIIKTLFVIYFFLAIFLPNLIKINLYVVFFAINVMGIAFYSIIQKKIIINKRLLGFIKGFLPFIVYFIIVQWTYIVINSGEQRGVYYQQFRQMGIVFLYSVSLCYFFFIMVNSIGFSFENLEIILSNVGIIQTVCVLLALWFPAIKTFFLNLVLVNSDNDIIKAAVKNYSHYRCFGLSNNLFDSFGYIMAIIIIVTFIYGLETQKRIYIVLSVSFLIAPMLNARTGIIISMAGFVLSIMYYFNIHTLIKILFYSIIMVGFVYIIFNNLPQITQRFILDGIVSTEELIVNGDTSTGVYKEILGKDIVWPENIFFGEGASPEALALHTGIDSGYIQCLWRFGLFGTILLLLGYANMFFIAYKCGKSKSSRITIICIMFAFFLYLFKLYPIMNFGATILIFGIPTIIVCNYIKSNDGEKEHEPQKSITSGKRYNSNLQKV